MSRLVGPDDRWVVRTAANRRALTSTAGSEVTIWTAETGGSLANILTVGGDAVAGSVLTVDENSLLPLFQFPDGVDTVWAEVGGDVRFPLYAREDDRLDALLAAGAAEAVTRAAADNLLATTVALTAETTRAIAAEALKAAKVSIVVDAAGNGDYTTVAAALAVVPAGGADVLVKRGTYTQTAALAVPAKTTLRGEGEGTIIKLGNAVNLNVIAVAGDDVTIRDLYIDGNRANQSGNGNGVYTASARTKVLDCHVVSANGYNIVGFAGATDMLVRGCVSEDARDEGIEFQGVVRGVIANNVVRTAGKNGIYVWANTAQGGTCKDVTISGNEVYNAASLTASFAGIRVDDGAIGVTVVGNTVSGGGTTALGIHVASSTASRVQYVSVTGNVITGAPGTGLRVAVADDVTVTGNSVTGSGEYGILITAAATKVTVKANTVRGTGGLYAGIQSSSACLDVAIIGNIVSLTTQHGIEVSAQIGGTIAGNTVKSCGGSNYNGIYVYGASAGLAITANSISLSGRAGIRVEDAINCSIVGNIIRSSGQGGSVALSAAINVTKTSGTCSGHVIQGNRCYDDQASKKQYYGLRIIGAVDNCLIGANLFSGGATGGSDAYVDPTATNISSIAYRKVTATVGTSQTAVAHGLPYIPQAISVSMTSAGTIWKSAASDATNIYLTADAAARTADVLVG